MCEKTKNYFETIRQYTREIVMFGGFGLACFFYSDFRDLTKEASAQQARTAEILSNIELRMDMLDRRVEHLEHDHQRAIESAAKSSNH